MKTFFRTIFTFSVGYSVPSARNAGVMAILLIAFTSSAVMAASRSASEQDPSYYVRETTWQDSMISSLKVLAARPVEDGFTRFDSPILRGGDPAQKVTIPLTGAKEMYLFATGNPDIKWGVADWADARLIAKDGSTASLTSLNLDVILGRHERNLTLRSGLYQKMRLGDRTFDRGLQVQADSIVRVPLESHYDRFEAWIGIDAWAGTNGHVRFSVTGARTAARKRLWLLLARDFPESLPRQQMRWEQEDGIFEDEWVAGNFSELAGRYATAARRIAPLARHAAQLAGKAATQSELLAVRNLYYRSRSLHDSVSRARRFDFQALRLALTDLAETFPARYPDKFATRLDALENELRQALSISELNQLEPFEQIARLEDELQNLRRDALLANPLLDFDRLLVIKRKPVGEPRRAQWEDRGLGEFIGLPKQSSWGNATIPKVDTWDNEIAVLSPIRTNGNLTTLYKPDGRGILTDVDLHFDADKLLFSMPDHQKRWQIFELKFGSSARQLTPSDHPDVHNYDAFYLPSGKIDFVSTAPLQGVPCNAGVIVGMMYQMDADGRNIHQICFEQDHDYTPSVLNDGRVLYLRWDYTDTPHVWNRILMSMNPDGTGQMQYYGGSSYWPNAVFFARAIPNHPTKIVGIVTGHHEGRVGELIVFDPSRGTQEADGVVQRIPGRGKKVKPLIEDKLTEHSWPKLVHPWPLSEKYFLVACKPEPHSLWGIYLVDVFDNMLLIKEEEHFVLLEPIPFRKVATPPVIPEKVQPERDDALVYLEDVYSGPGLRGVPRGAVKNLRLFTYHFGYQTLAGIDHRVGADGPWESKRVLGTVPVHSDGSAMFRIPAKTPISVQPLDAEGRALALMRSWMTAMPGENLSCVGCHDQSSAAPPVQRTTALEGPPSEIQPWYGPTRGFSFAREVQPVLDQFCVGCHDGKTLTIPDLRGDQGAFVVYQHGKVDGQIVRGVPKSELLGKYSAVFEPSYATLRQYIRVGGLESDLHVLPPKEFHANTSELIQMLQKGHHNVQLDAEAWDRLVTWIDLNAPCHGTWQEVTRLPGNQRARRVALRKLYGGIAEDWEEPTQPILAAVAPILPPQSVAPKPAPIHSSEWPMDEKTAQQRQSLQGAVSRKIDLGDGVPMEFVRIPAGSFVMGDSAGEIDEQPPALVEIDQAFWMARFEVTNEQFRKFDPSHDSRFEHRSSWIFSEEYLGWPLNRPRQPVVRVSWTEAMAFCRWLSNKLGETVTLPTEAQWEYACRAGTASPLSYGGIDADFSLFANLGDANLRKLADEGWRPKAPDLVPREDRFNDGALVTAEAGRYKPNAWGLYDMHGNAAEWTRTRFAPYPYRADDGRDLANDDSPKAVRGGSWRDRPKRSRSAFRLSYPAHQKVFNVGFRVVIDSSARSVASLTTDP